MFTTARAAALEIGTASSGNRGHAGRKGKRGGSAPRGAGSVDYGVLSPDVLGNSEERLIPEFANKLRMHQNDAALLFRDLPSGLDPRLAGQIKARICDELADATGLDPSDISTVVHQWAETSNDTCYASLHIQKMVAEEFGVEMSEFQKEKFKYVDSVREFYLKELGGDEEALHVFAHGEYIGDGKNFVMVYKGKGYSLPNAEANDIFDRQKELFPHGSILAGDRILSDKDTRKLLRAMYDRTQKVLADAGIENLDVHRGFRSGKHPAARLEETKQRCLYAGNACESFSLNLNTAQRFGRHIISTTVPRKRILATFLTGFGCADEAEVVILGGRGNDICNAYSL